MDVVLRDELSYLGVTLGFCHQQYGKTELSCVICGKYKPDFAALGLPKRMQNVSWIIYYMNYMSGHDSVLE